MENKVVTRFAPSPTGLLHLGNYRTAIFAYLYAKKHNGVFVLRIEDTDKERSKKEYEENIIESLKWLGLSQDKFYRQSEHIGKHKFYLEKMIKEGNAYTSKEEAKDGSGVIKELIRFKNPNITFQDEIKGEVTMNTTDLGDFIIAKNFNEPLFHLAVVVDDFEAGITHVIRGEDHTSNTVRQILIQRAIGAPTPVYAHLPLVLGSDKLKLSKRRGALPLTEYKKLGFLPEAVLNGVAFVGWNPGTEKEIFTHDELVEAFDLKGVQKSPAIFNQEKLRWFNKEHIKKLNDAEFIERAKPFIDPEIKTSKGLKEIEFDNFILQFRYRISVFSDLNNLMRNNIAQAGQILDDENSISISGPNDFLLKNKDPSISEVVKLLIPKDIKNDDKSKIVNNYIKYLSKANELLQEDDWREVENKDRSNLWIYSGEEGRSNVLQPLRLVLSGQKDSDSTFEIMKKIGKESTLRRIENILEPLMNLPDNLEDFDTSANTMSELGKF